MSQEAPKRMKHIFLENATAFSHPRISYKPKNALLRMAMKTIFRSGTKKDCFTESITRYEYSSEVVGIKTELLMPVV